MWLLVLMISGYIIPCTVSRHRFLPSGCSQDSVRPAVSHPELVSGLVVSRDDERRRWAVKHHLIETWYKIEDIKNSKTRVLFYKGLVKDLEREKSRLEKLSMKEGKPVLLHGVRKFSEAEAKQKALSEQQVSETQGVGLKEPDENSPASAWEIWEDLQKIKSIKVDDMGVSRKRPKPMFKEDELEATLAEQLEKVRDDFETEISTTEQPGLSVGLSSHNWWHFNHKKRYRGKGNVKKSKPITPTPAEVTVLAENYIHNRRLDDLKKLHHDIENEDATPIPTEETLPSENAFSRWFGSMFRKHNRRSKNIQKREEPMVAKPGLNEGAITQRTEIKSRTARKFYQWNKTDKGKHRGRGKRIVYELSTGRAQHKYQKLRTSENCRENTALGDWKTVRDRLQTCKSRGIRRHIGWGSVELKREKRKVEKGLPHPLPYKVYAGGEYYNIYDKRAIKEAVARDITLPPPIDVTESSKTLEGLDNLEMPESKNPAAAIIGKTPAESALVPAAAVGGLAVGKAASDDPYDEDDDLDDLEADEKHLVPEVKSEKATVRPIKKKKPKAKINTKSLAAAADHRVKSFIIFFVAITGVITVIAVLLIMALKTSGQQGLVYRTKRRHFKDCPCYREMLLKQHEDRYHKRRPVYQHYEPETPQPGQLGVTFAQPQAARQCHTSKDPQGKLIEICDQEAQTLHEFGLGGQHVHEQFRHLKENAGSSVVSSSSSVPAHADHEIPAYFMTTSPRNYHMSRSQSMVPSERTHSTVSMERSNSIFPPPRLISIVTEHGVNPRKRSVFFQEPQKTSSSETASSEVSDTPRPRRKSRSPTPYPASSSFDDANQSRRLALPFSTHGRGKYPVTFQRRPRGIDERFSRDLCNNRRNGKYLSSSSSEMVSFLKSIRREKDGIMKTDHRDEFDVKRYSQRRRLSLSPKLRLSQLTIHTTGGALAQNFNKRPSL